MKQCTIIRTLTAGAAIVAAVAGSIAAAAPARADSFRIDDDHVVLGTSTVNDYKAFSGWIIWTHNGSRIVGNLAGTHYGRGYVRVTWFLNGGTSKTDSVYTDGVTKTVDLYSPASADVVRAAVAYEPNSSVNTSNLTHMSETNFVGDSPDSMGVCGRLDSDKPSVSNSYASFAGVVTWFCDSSTGRVMAALDGTMSPKAGAPDDSYLVVHINYADGTRDTFVGWDVTSGSGAVTQSAWSNQAKQARSVDMALAGSQASWPTDMVKFGDY